LIERVQRPRGGRWLLTGTSYGGGTIPQENVVRASNFLLLHGNGVSNPDRIADMVRRTRAVPGYRIMPVLFNEDDHFDFDKPKNNLIAAVSERASWGYFDFRMKGEGFDEGYQSVPVNWGLSSARKRGFFGLLAEITGPAGSGITIVQTNYHGWTNALVMGNGQVEAAIVPAIGRVMQFGFRGKAGVFWNSSLEGKPALEGDWKATDWVNLGGDKSWPAPEGDWSRFTQRKSWRPPPAFDGLPAEAHIDGSDVVMVSPVDSLLRHPCDPPRPTRSRRARDAHRDDLRSRVGRTGEDRRVGNHASCRNLRL
jgi:hypothetical protein